MHTHASLCSRLCLVSLAVTWIAAAALKVFAVSSTRQTLVGHGIPPQVAMHLAILLPVLEFAVGLGVALLYPTRPGRPPTRAVALWVSAGLLAGFTVYILIIPAATISKHGCGCLGGEPLFPNAVGSLHARMWVMLRNAVLLALHVPALAGLVSHRNQPGPG